MPTAEAANSCEPGNDAPIPQTAQRRRSDLMSSLGTHRRRRPISATLTRTSPSAAIARADRVLLSLRRKPQHKPYRRPSQCFRALHDGSLLCQSDRSGLQKSCTEKRLAGNRRFFSTRPETGMGQSSGSLTDVSGCGSMGLRREARMSLIHGLDVTAPRRSNASGVLF